jgi:hypothetical protein
MVGGVVCLVHSASRAIAFAMNKNILQRPPGNQLVS